VHKIRVKSKTIESIYICTFLYNSLTSTLPVWGHVG